MTDAPADLLAVDPAAVSAWWAGLSAAEQSDVTACRGRIDPPPFVVTLGDRSEEAASFEEFARSVLGVAQRQRGITVNRFKGLGEMNAEDLEETTMAPGRRKLVQVELDPQFEVEIEMMFSRLMGDNVAPRREFIERHAKTAMDVDWHY